MTTPDITAEMEAATERVQELGAQVTEQASTLATSHANSVRATSEVFFSTMGRQLES